MANLVDLEKLISDELKCLELAKQIFLARVQSGMPPEDVDYDDCITCADDVIETNKNRLNEIQKIFQDD